MADHRKRARQRKAAHKARKAATADVHVPYLLPPFAPPLPSMALGSVAAFGALSAALSANRNDS